MDAGKEFKTFVFIFLMIALIWLFTGGPLRPSAKSGLFLFRPQEKAAEQVQKPLKQITGGKPSTAPAASQETIDTATLNVRNAKESDPNKEYVEIQASKDNKNPLNISKWRLKGKIGLDIAVGQGTILYLPGQNNPRQEIILKPGGKAVIVTGASPLGTNFHLNKCIGYFEQFQNFIPRLPQECPPAKDEVLPNNLDDKCLDYIERVPRCEVIKSIPPIMSSSCQDYLSVKITYNSCVEIHKNDTDFYKPEWRVYLGREEELWKKNRDTIVLMDQNGKIIDSESY